MPASTAPPKVPYALILLGALLFASFTLNPLLGKEPNRTQIERAYQPPSREHFFGTDQSGRDVFARVIDATKLDLGIAAGSSAAAFLIGTAIGALSGYLGGRADQWIMRLFDIWQAIPGLLLGLLVLAILGEGLLPLIGVIAAINIPVYGRLARAELLPERRSVQVEAARLSHVPEWRILLVYLLPKGLTSCLAYLPVQAGFSIAIASGFGFIGLGIQAPTPEWGTMIAEGLGDLLFLHTWWTTFFPGLFLAMTIVLLYRTGDWLMGRLMPNE